ncbi:MAG TPA: hypothetical protein VHO48_02350 [Anaerolineaceae bacterium]|nr:hypothetical protein [Anaerolineaceae bacterium]
MKAVAIILSIIVFTACLVLGIQAGNSSSLGNPNDPNPAEQTVATLAPQRTLLLVGVDDLQAASPRLISLWVLFYRTDLSHVTVLPLYPNSDTARSQEISQAFTLTDERAPSDTFFSALKAERFQWTGYVLADQAATSQMIDWLQGVDLQGATLDGAGALASLVDPWADLPGALDSQRRLGEGLCAKVAQLPSDSGWLAQTAGLIPTHLRTDLGLEMVFADWGALKGAAAPLSCEFPTE